MPSSWLSDQLSLMMCLANSNTSDARCMLLVLFLPRSCVVCSHNSNDGLVLLLLHVSGGPGGMMFCDGSDDFLYEKDFQLGGFVSDDRVRVRLLLL